MKNNLTHKKIKCLLLAMTILLTFSSCIVLASCKQNGSIKKLENAVAKNNIKKAEKELQKLPHISEAEYSRLCQLSIENKNLALPLMLIEKGMSPNIYIGDSPLSFYFVDLATDSEFSQLLKSMAKDSSEASFINQAFRILQYAIRTKKFSYAHAIIEDVDFAEKTRYDCLKYFEELLLKQVPKDLTASFLKKNKDTLLKTEMFPYNLAVHYSYLKDCGLELSDAKLIIEDETVADILLDGEPEGIKFLLNKIDCKKSYPMNGELRKIRDILHYRIRIKSGAIDGSYEEMQEKNKTEIQLLKEIMMQI